MIVMKRMSAVVALSFLALSTALAPAAAQSDTHRQHHGRWHGAASAGTAYGNARYQPWPYAPGQDRIDEGHGFYEGYGFNSNNACYPGESMYDGC
jgi:opacity protein-like surface antigen